MKWIGISADGKTFIEVPSGKPFLMWGVNYDHDRENVLMDDYWVDQWETVVEDFHEMKAMGFNTIRIHLQLGRFMDTPTQANKQSLEQLAKMIQLAEECELYLYVTGLACYLQKNIPDWYDELHEKDRWNVQAEFWKAVARVCADSPAVLCYDLMNEPEILERPTEEWLPYEGRLGEFCYGQALTKNPNGRTAQEIAKAWISVLVSAIRSVDCRTLITVGAVPMELYTHLWPDGIPVFHDRDVCKQLDFISVHFYPVRNEVDNALRILALYDIGKPLVIAETFAMSCSIEEMDQFIEASRANTQGWISFYWGETIEEYAQSKTVRGAIMKPWLEYFQNKGKQILMINN